MYNKSWIRTPFVADFYEQLLFRYYGEKLTNKFVDELGKKRTMIAYKWKDRYFVEVI